MTTIDARPSSSYSLSFGGILRSEWIKLRTVRSTSWCYLIIVVLTIGLGCLVAASIPATAISAGAGADVRTAQQAFWLQMTTLGLSFGELVSAVLGTLVITGEYGTGMIRSTITAVPARVPALIAKAIVFGVTTFVVGLVSLVATVLLTAPLLAAKGLHPDLGDAAVWGAIVGGAGFLALIGMLSLSIGAIIRNSAGGIAISLGLILVLPIVLSIFALVTQADWTRNLETFMPAAAGGRMYAYVTGATPGLPPGTIVLEPWQGFLVLVGWVVVLFIGASALFKRRDA
jgi:ABC-2 type transport system permease protein